MIITTTPTVEGMHIKEYLGIVSGTHIYTVGGWLGGGLGSQEKLLPNAFETAKIWMEQRASELGADAVVGLQTNILSPGNLNFIIVAITGTAVKLSYGIEEFDELPEF